MITLKELKKKADNLYQPFLLSHLQGQPFFPKTIPCDKKVNFAIKEDIDRMREVIINSRAHIGYGYTVELKTAKTQQHGVQSTVSEISFENAGDLLKFIGKEKEFRQLEHDFALIGQEVPGLQQWAAQHPKLLIRYGTVWPQLLDVCRYFIENPKPNLYIRQLPIEGIDTKFIESHKLILKDLLDEVIPPEYINREFDGTDRNNFEKRFNLCYDEYFVRFRILDQHLLINGVLSDLSLLVSEFAMLDLPCERVFITENKMPGLTFPPMEKSIVIFGMGNGVSLLKSAAWLARKQVFYWGDIDTHGFHILSSLRAHFPAVHSLMMDRETFESFAKERGNEPSPDCSMPAHLAPDEKQLFLHLAEQLSGNRLEQEKVSHQFIIGQLEKTCAMFMKQTTID